MKKSQRWKNKVKKLIVGRSKDTQRHKVHGRQKL
jgi:hypothetical protein